MALLFPASMRVTNSAGTPISGGKARVYNVNTTTLSTLYSDAAMLTPLTNPVTADANGWLGAIFAAESTYDIAFLDASSAALTGQAWEDWPTFPGTSANSIERTLSGARLDIDGGDIGDGTTGVRFQAGQPSPTDTGGYLGIMGWNGTRLTKLNVDATTADFETTKSLKEGGLLLAHFLQTDKTAFTAASTVDIPLTNTPSGTRRWRVTIFDIDASSDVTGLGLRLSFDSASTFKSGASDYSYAITATSGAGIGQDIDDAADHVRVRDVSASGTTHWLVLEFDIITPNSGNGNTLIWGNMMGYNNNGTAGTAVVNYSIAGACYGNYGRATHVRFYPGAGTVTGSYTVSQYRGFGEA